MTARKDYFSYFPHGLVNDGKKRFAKFHDNREFHEKQIEKRHALIKEKGFELGRPISYNKKVGIIRELKDFSKDGFLIIKGSNSREDPREWDPIV